MTLLAVHLEQIALSCDGINSLPFPRPKIFTNALLKNNDITSLIRDTEAHERALFSVPPTVTTTTAAAAAVLPAQEPEKQQQQGGTKRRQTVFNVSSGEVTAGGAPSSHTQTLATRRNTAVAAVLGGDLHAQLRRGEVAARRAGGGGAGGTGNGDVDVEVLLHGAEKLCGVYAPPGARERIADVRARWTAGESTLEYYEQKVAEQMRRLDTMRARGDLWDDEPEEEEDDDGDVKMEEEEVRELERKKRELQARLRTMERDLGGLRRMEA